MLSDDGMNLVTSQLIVTNKQLWTLGSWDVCTLCFVCLFVGLSSRKTSCHRGPDAQQLQDPTAVAEFAEILAKILGTPLISGLLSQVEGVTGR